MDLLMVVIILALVATIASLIMGVWSMGHGGEFDKRHSNQLMRARVGFQGIALVLMLAALFFANQ
ncbi:MAG: twin transmembrane helix small protein [Pseudomonadota bacterium]